MATHGNKETKQKKRQEALNILAMQAEYAEYVG
jgi:hypothetical protein